MRRKLTSLLLTLAVVITLALPYNVSAAELNEVPLTIEDTAFTNQESCGNPEDATAGDPNVPEVPGDEDSNVPESPEDEDSNAPESPEDEDSNAPESPENEDSNAPDAPELPEDGSMPETPPEDETDSGVSDHNPGEETTGTGSSDTDNPENAELPVINADPENGEEDMEDPSSANAASSNIAYPQMTGYYLVKISGMVKNPSGKGSYRVTENCNMSEQRSTPTTTYVTQNRFLPEDEIVLTFFHEGIGKTSKYMHSGGGYNVVNGPGYGSKTDANNRVLSYYTDTTISHMDASLTEISATCAMTEQRESPFHEPKEWSRSIQILFYNDREDGPTNVHFALDPNNSEQYILHNVNSTMEYRMGYSNTWTSCTDEVMTFAIPTQTTYYQVRYKATADAGVSNHVDVYLPSRRSAPAVSINWVDESLNKPDVTAGLEYSFNNSEYVSADDLLENGVTNLLDQIPTPGPVYLRFRYAADTEQPVSLVTSIRIYPRGPVPEGVVINPNTYIATGVSTSMQYFVEGNTSWWNISGTTLNLLGYAQSDKEVTVKFRSKATSSTCLSKPLVLTLPKLASAPSTLALDFASETITGFQPDQSYQYRIGTGKWGNVTLSNQAFSIKNLVLSTGDRLLSIRSVGSEGAQATDAWQVTLPKREAAPTNFVFVYNDESYPGKAVLSGVSSDMEYTVKGSSLLTSFDGPQKVFDLPKSATVYYIRFKSTASSFASLYRTVTLYAPAAAPTNALNMTSEKLTISASMEYRIDNGTYMKMPSGETVLLVTDYINALSGSATKTITIRYSATATKPASLEKTIKLVARRAAPTKVTYTVNDQNIRGATTSMQYREVGTTGWRNVIKTPFSIASILNGRTDVVMEFRYKPTTTAVGSYTQRVNCF